MVCSRSPPRIIVFRFLAEHFGCVLAVDPAELDEEVAKLQTVKHIKCLLQSSDAAQGGTSDA